MDNILLPLCRDGGACVLSVHATPKASRDAIEGIEEDANGKCWLRLRVTSPPEEGRANKAVVKLLAKQWKIAAGRFTLIQGETARYKRIRIVASYEEIAACLTRNRT